MLIAIQFPLADKRSFSLTAANRLPLPSWPIPRVDREFVRWFGRARRRRRGGIGIEVGLWHDEAFFCDAKRAFRYPPSIRRFAWGETRSAFRRLFCDGYACVRVESACVVKVRTEVTGRQLLQLLRDFWAIRVGVPLPPERMIHRKMICQGTSLARLFSFASTPSVKWPHAETATTVSAGEPAVIVEYTNTEVQSLPRECQLVEFGGSVPVALHFARFYLEGTYVSVWFLPRTCQSRQEYEVRRRLRLSIFRLHAEWQVLQEVLRGIIKREIHYEPKTDAGECLEKYLNYATRTLGGQRLHGIEQDPIQSVINSFGESIAEDERELLLHLLADSRRQIRKKLASITAIHTKRTEYYHLYGGNVYAAEAVSQQGGVVMGNTSIRFGDGNTFNGDVVAAANIESSFNRAREAQSPTLALELATLLSAISALCEKLEPNEQQRVSRKAKSFVDEATSTNPDQGFLSSVGQNLISAANVVAEFVKPVSEAVSHVLKLI